PPGPGTASPDLVDGSRGAIPSMHCDPDDALADLHTYRAHPAKTDTTERVDLFTAWLTEATPARSTD
ncbi:MAG: hypothetical protein JWQ26_2422, partial [Modestobacter sp.]|nr:hypothetical protein [Modestobacter sp.]